MEMVSLVKYEQNKVITPWNSFMEAFQYALNSIKECMLTKVDLDSC